MSSRSTLIRGLGLFGAISINITNMIGTGVFLKTRVMTCNVGTPGMVMLVWMAAGLLSLAGSFSYAEVAAMIPESGGDYVFLRRAYGRFVGFLYGWTFFTVAKAGAQSALAQGFAIFLNVALNDKLEGALLHLAAFGFAITIDRLTVFALIAIWLVALLNCGSVTRGGQVALFLTIAKIVLIAAISIASFALTRNGWAHFAMTAAGGTCEGVARSARGGLAGFGAAMLGALWAYDGWNNVAPLCGEIKDPQRNIPRAFVGGVLIVCALYIAINMGYFIALTPRQIASLSGTTSVATEVMKTFIGPAAVSATAVALMVSSFGSLHASALANARIPFAMANEGLFFRKLADVSPRTRVPVKAIMAQAAWASVLVISGSYDALTDSVVFVSWVFFGLSAAMLFIFRRTMPDEPRPYRAFGYPLVQVVFLCVTAWLIVNTFVATPAQALTGVAMMVTGLPFYFYWIRQPGLRA